MKRREFLYKTTLGMIVYTTSCSQLPFLKKEKIVCLEQLLSQPRIGSDGIGEYYLYKLNSDQDIAFRMTPIEKMKYDLEDCFSIMPGEIRDEYPYKDRNLKVYQIKEKIN